MLPPPRRRQLGDPGVTKPCKLVRKHQFYPYTGTTQRYYFQAFQAMNDCVGSVTENHPVIQTKVLFFPSFVNKWTINTGSPVGVATWNAFPYWVPPTTNSIHYQRIRDKIVFPDYSWGSERYHDFSVAAIASLTQQIPDVIDVPHLLQDVLTLRGLVKQVGQVARRLKKLLSIAGLYRPSKSHQTLRQLVGEGANAYLLNEFGIKPLLGELESAFASLEPAFSRLEFLRQTAGSAFTAHYSESDQVVLADQDWGLADGVSMGTCHLWCRELQGRMKYTATARVKNTLRGLDRADAGLKTVLAALGGQNMVVFLWDLVPFSFVIDWNYSVDAALKRYFTLSPFGGELKIIRSCVSQKCEVSGKLYVEGNQLTDGPISVGTVIKHSYERENGLRADLNWFRPFESLTPKQLGLLTALVSQRVA